MLVAVFVAVGVFAGHVEGNARACAALIAIGHEQEVRDLGRIENRAVDTSRIRWAAAWATWLMRSVPARVQIPEPAGVLKSMKTEPSRGLPTEKRGPVPAVDISIERQAIPRRRS